MPFFGVGSLIVVKLAEGRIFKDAEHFEKSGASRQFSSSSRGSQNTSPSAEELSVPVKRLARNSSRT